jgi:hypothetical protein
MFDLDDARELLHDLELLLNDNEGELEDAYYDNRNTSDRELALVRQPAQ